MERATDENKRTASTRWVRKTIKVPVPAEGQRHVPPQAGPLRGRADVARGWRRFPSYDLKRRRERLTITVSYRGGPECWYEVRARGSIGRFPGHVCIHDLMSDVYNVSQTPASID